MTPKVKKKMAAAAKERQSDIKSQRSTASGIKKRSRGAETSPGRSSKRKKMSKSESRRADANSVLYDAQAHLLATVKFPVDFLTGKWSTGHNRSLDQKHVKKLVGAFESQGLRREEAHNRLIVLCSKAHVEDMRAHISKSPPARVLDEPPTNGSGAGSGTTRRVVADPPVVEDFREWGSIIKTEAELIAGAHRVAALKVHLADAEESEHWWLCDIYDKDTTPRGLLVKLRANRQHVALPDSNGQIWAELVTLAETDNILKHQADKLTRDELAAHIRKELNLGPNEPALRIVTLWKSHAWKPEITRWCEYAFGQELFKITACADRIAHRIDNLWFIPMQQAIETAKELFGDRDARGVTLADISKLATLSRNADRSTVSALFYPPSGATTRTRRRLQAEPTSAESADEASRCKGFLVHLSDKSYHDIYTRLPCHKPGPSPWLDSDAIFPNIHALFKIKSGEGGDISNIMRHVSHWLNRDGIKKPLDTERNKSQLWCEFLNGFQRIHPDKDNAFWSSKALCLEKKVLNFAIKHVKRISKEDREALNKYPDDLETVEYCERFSTPLWRQLLREVHTVIGPNFQHAVMEEYNHASLDELGAELTSEIVKTMCRSLQQMPDVAKQPALGRKAALLELQRLIRPIITRWAADQCASVLAEWSDWEEAYSKHHGSKAKEEVERQLSTYQSFLQECATGSSPTTVSNRRKSTSIDTGGSTRLGLANADRRVCDGTGDVIVAQEEVCPDLEDDTNARQEEDILSPEEQAMRSIAVFPEPKAVSPTRQPDIKAHTIQHVSSEIYPTLEQHFLLDLHKRKPQLRKENKARSSAQKKALAPPSTTSDSQPSGSDPGVSRKDPYASREGLDPGNQGTEGPPKQAEQNGLPTSQSKANSEFWRSIVTSKNTGLKTDRPRGSGKNHKP